MFLNLREVSRQSSTAHQLHLTRHYLFGHMTISVSRQWRGWWCAALLMCALCPLHAWAESSSIEELARKFQSPLTDVVSVPFQYNTFFGVGPGNATSHLLNISPIVPIHLGDWHIVTRTVIPVISVSRFTPGLEDEIPGTGGGTATGLGDINFTPFLTPGRNGMLSWGIGPSVTLPTSTHEVLGSRKWSAGPSAVIMFRYSPVVGGVLVRQQWSFAGSAGSPSVSQFLLQPFASLNLARGWFLTSAPILTANWEGQAGNKWVVPVGGGVGRAFVLDHQPMSITAQAYYHVIRPDLGAEWQTRVTMQFLF